MSAKYIFITGGVVSGLGKGIATASIGRLLKARGYKVALQKFDPYINLDPGGMSPLQHGELFVTEDGAETDLNIGHYERIADEKLGALSNITTGRIYFNVINKERLGEYGGETVQVIPHITSEIKRMVYDTANRTGADIVITEIGGTVGDIESQPFLEAIRQISGEQGTENALFIHETLVPFISGSSELKTKPTQHSVKELLSIGIQPQILICRCGLQLQEDMKAKIALFCNTRSNDVIAQMTCKSIYEVPLCLEEEGLAHSICYHLELEDKTPELSGWIEMIKAIKNPTKFAKVALVGKYARMHDAYLSTAEALYHGGIAADADVEIIWIETSEIIKTGTDCLKDVDGVVSVDADAEDCEGYVAVARYCRENNKPFFGIGYGMFGAIIDAARNLAGIKAAGSSEFGSEEPVIHYLVDAATGEGPVFRVGVEPCNLMEGSRIFEIYKDSLVYERHHSRYEVNPLYIDTLRSAGLEISAISPDGYLTEAIEYSKLKWFIAVQFAPQFVSRPDRQHPLFADFIKAIAK